MVSVSKKSKPDMINHPNHYTHGPIEVIEVIEGFKLNYHLGTVIKYLLRAGHKNDALEDIKKARWFLDREIKRREKEENAVT